MSRECLILFIFESQQLTVYTTINGYDEQNLSLCACMYHALNTKTLSIINQQDFPHHMHTPQGPIKPHHMIHGFFDLSEADKSEWYSYSTPFSVEVLFMVQFQRE